MICAAICKTIKYSDLIDENGITTSIYSGFDWFCAIWSFIGLATLIACINKTYK